MPEFKENIKENITITAEDLKSLVATAVATAIQESKKPAPLSARELSELQMKQEYRASEAEQVLAAIANKRHGQMLCSHEHSRHEGSGTHCVWVRESEPVGSPGYILCQKCFGRFRPETGFNPKLDPSAIYDTAKFNELFQTCQHTGS